MTDGYIKKSELLEAIERYRPTWTMYKYSHEGEEIGSIDIDSALYDTALSMYNCIMSEIERFRVVACHTVKNIYTHKMLEKYINNGYAKAEAFNYIIAEMTNDEILADIEECLKDYEFEIAEDKETYIKFILEAVGELRKEQT